MVFEKYTKPDDVIFRQAEGMIKMTDAGRKYGAYYIDSYMLSLIKTGLNCLKYRQTDNQIEKDDILLALDLVSKQFDKLTE